MPTFGEAITNDGAGKEEPTVKRGTPKEVPTITKVIMNNGIDNEVPIFIDGTVNDETTQSSLMDKFYDWDDETLVALHGDDDVLDI